MQGHSGRVYSVAITPDSKLIVSGGSDSSIKIWNLNSGQEIATLTGHTQIVVSVAISSNGLILVSGSCD